MSYICTNCNYKGQRKKVNAGSKLGSFMWWFAVPSLWGLVSGGGSIIPQISMDPVEAAQYLQSFSSGGFAKEIVISCIPGAIYSVWRRVKKVDVCPMCGSKSMVPDLGDAALLDGDVSDKEHFVEMARKLAEMERQLKEQKITTAPSPADIKEALAKPVAVPAAKPIAAKPVIEPLKEIQPPVKIEHNEESKKEW